MTASPAQLRYLADAVNTASPAQRLVMLYDRLLLDIRRAGQAQQRGDAFEGAAQLRHGQQIVAELRSSLRVEGWPGADNLASLYGYLLTELVDLAGSEDQQRLDAVAEIVVGLRESWRQAAEQLTAPPTAELSEPVSHGARQTAWVG